MHRERTMGKHKLGFLAFDSVNEKHAVAIADDGRDGEVHYLGEIDNSPDAVRKLVAKLSRQYERLRFCYEAGPTGYGLHRQLTDLGQVCDVIAPTMIPKRSGDRVKTSRRDSLTLVKLLRAGELRAIWVPDSVHEAVRDLTRARKVAMLDLKKKRQQVALCTCSEAGHQRLCRTSEVPSLTDPLCAARVGQIQTSRLSHPPPPRFSEPRPIHRAHGRTIHPLARPG
jgi:hypothetical protein